VADKYLALKWFTAAAEQGDGPAAENLADMYKKEGSKINPLMLIQLPDNKAGITSKKEEVIKILEKKGLTEKNGCINCSENIYLIKK
jgi:TPR repeat protein